MRVVHADFKSLTRPPKLLWTVVGICIALTFALSLYLTRELVSLQNDLETKLAATTAPPTAKAQIQHEEVRYAASAREMQAQRQLGWPLALTALENIAAEGVVVRRIEVSATEESIRVELVAPSHASVLEYLVALNSGGGQENTDLLWTLQRAEAEPAGQSVRATLVARKATRMGPKE